MRPTSQKLTAAAITMFTFGLLAITAPTAARADDYCITNGSQAAHGCGYPTMEACRAASAGIGGTCSAGASSRNSSDALAYQMKAPHSRSGLRYRREPAER